MDTLNRLVDWRGCSEFHCGWSDENDKVLTDVVSVDMRAGGVHRDFLGGGDVRGA